MKVRTSVLRGFALLALSSLAFTACDEKAPIEPPPAPEVIVTPSSATLEVGQQTSFVAVVRNSTNQTVAWASSTPSVATVNPTTGVVTAVAPGSATITATSAADNTARAAAQVIVVAPTPVPPVIVGVVPSQATMVEGQTLQLVPVVQNATNTAVTYTSLDQSVATVSASGLVTAVDPGTAVIRVSSVQDPTKSATAVITVTAAPTPTPISVTITPSNASGVVGQQVGFSAVVNNSANQAVNWTSTVPSVATVDENGIATLLAAGSTVIRATSAEDPTKSASATLTVTAVPGETVVVTIVPTQVTLAPGQTQAFAASSSASGDVLTYTSSNTGVVTIDASTGVATAVAQGSAVITARSTVDPSRAAQAIVTVTSAPAVTITVNPTTIPSLGAGASTQIIATITGSDNQTVLCTSANTNIATATPTADGMGCVVTGVAAGSTVITVASAASPNRVQTVPVTVVGSSVAISTVNAAGFPNAVTGTVNTSVNVSVPAGTADRLAIRFTNVATGETFTITCQQFTAAGAATTVVCPVNTIAEMLPNATYTVSAVLFLGNDEVATAAFSQQITTANADGVVADVTFDNDEDPEQQINPNTGLPWFGGDVIVNLSSAIFTQGVTLSEVTIGFDNTCDTTNEIIRTVAIDASGNGTVTFTEDRTITQGNSTATSGNNLRGVGNVESASCVRLISARDQNNQAITLQAQGTFGGAVAFRLDNTAPTATPQFANIFTGGFVGADNDFNATGAGASGSAEVVALLDNGVNDASVQFFAVETADIPAGLTASQTRSFVVAEGIEFTNSDELAAFQSTSNTELTGVIVVTDLLGNSRIISADIPFGVDLAAPTVTAVADAPSINPGAATIGVAAEENLSGFPAEFVLVRMIRHDANGRFCLVDAGTDLTTATFAFSGNTGSNCPFVATSTPNIPIPGVEGYYEITVLVVDVAGNATTAISNTYLVDVTAPTPTVTGFSIAGGQMTVSGTITDNLDVLGYDTRLNFAVATEVLPAPFTGMQVAGAFGLPLTRTVTATGTTPVVRGIETTDGTGAIVGGPFALNAVGFGATDVAGNFAFAGQGVAPPTAPAGVAVNEFDLNAVANASGTQNILCVTGTSAACGSASLAGRTSTTLEAIAITGGGVTASPIARTYFYFMHPGQDQTLGTGDDYSVLIGSDESASLRVVTGSTDRNWVFSSVLSTSVLPAAAAGQNMNVYAIGVDAQGDAVLSQAVVFDVR